MKLSGFPGSEFIVEGINVPANSYGGKMGIVFHTLFGQGTFTYEFRRPGADPALRRVPRPLQVIR